MVLPRLVNNFPQTIPYTTCVSYLSTCTVLMYGEKFLQDKIFVFFHRLVSDHENFNHEIYSQCKPQPFLTVGVAYFRSVIIESLTSVCVMAMYHSVDKLP